MAGLHFPITADTSNFAKGINEVKASVTEASTLLKKIGKDFDISTVENKIISLNKIIRDNNEVIDKLSGQLKKWEQDAQEAFNNNDFDTLETINKDIDEQKKKISELTNETQQYVAVLATVQSSAGQEITTQSISAPKFFASEEDYQYAQKLQDKIIELQQTIANFDGSDEDLAGLRKELSETTAQLLATNTAAVQAASELGEDLGSRASKASSVLYELNKTIKEQKTTLEELKTKLSETTAELINLENNGGDAQVIENTRIQFDNLAQAVANAERQLAMLQAAQKDAAREMGKISDEADEQDSIMVKLLGGYENYQKILGKLPAPIQSVIGSINGMTGAAKAFIATPLGAIIAGIVLVLQTLKTWFDSTVEGQMAFAESSGYVSGILGQLKEIVIAVGKALYKAFTDPKKAIEEFWKAVKTNVVNRFKSLGDMAKSLGGLLKAALTFDTDGIKREFMNLTNSFLQFGTGIENVTGKVGNFVKKTHEAAKTQAQLNKEAKEIDIAEHIKGIADAKRQKEMTEARAVITDNSKKGSKEQREAQEKFDKLNKEQTKADLALIDRKIKHQEITMSLTSNTIEYENKLRDLQAQREQALAQEAQRNIMLNRLNNRLDKAPTGKSADQLSSDQQKAHQKLLDLMKSQTDERLRLQQEYEYQIWQNRIDLMDDGEEKVLAQQRLNNDKELTELKRQQKAEEEAELQRQMVLFNAKQDELAAGNKKYAKKVFRDSDIDQSEFDKIKERYNKLQQDILSKQQKSEQDRLDSAKEAMNAYLREFGNYQQKREAIAEEYEKKISEAQNAGERKMAMAQRNQALVDLDFNEWQEGGGMAMAFGDVSKLSGDTIKNLISEMEKYREKVIKTFDPDKIEKFENALNNLRMADVDMDFTFAGDNEIIESLKERLTLQKQIADEEANTTALQEQKAQLEEELNALNEQLLQGSLNTTAIGPDGKPAVENIGISEDDKKRAEELQVKIDSVSQALAKSARNSTALNSQLRQMGKVKFADIQKFSRNLLNAGKNASQLVSIFSEDLAEAIDTGVSSLETMFDAFDTLSSNIETLAKAGKDIVKETTDSAKTIVDASADGMKASAAATATSLSTIEKASAILAIIGAAIQLATMVASLFNKDKSHEKNIERLQERIDALQKSYDRLGKSIDNTYSTDASELIGQQETLLKQQKELIRLQIAEEEAKKKTDDEKIKSYKEQLEDIDDLIADNKKKAKEAIIGEDLKSAINEFASLYAEAWDDGTDAAQASMKAVKSIITSALNELLKKNIQPAATRFYDALAEAMKDGVLTDAELDNLDAIKKQIDTLASDSEEQYRKIQDRYKDLDELREELTDISFDSVKDNFKSLLSDMDSSAKDFSDSFSDMLRNALIEGLMNDKYDAMLKEWYDEFAEAMNDRSLTDSERETLKQKYNAIVNQGLEDRDFINSIVGGEAYSQEASKGGWGAMSQDTADELNGRFTALTELNAINNNLVSEGNQIAREILITLQLYSSLSNVTSDENPTLLAIKDMMFLATGHLEDIAKYTKLLNNITSGIDNLNDLINKRL